MKFISLSRTAAMIVKEFRQILRDRATLAMIIAMPLMLMLPSWFGAGTASGSLIAAASSPAR